MRSPSQSGVCSKQHMSLIKYRPVLFCLWLTAIIQIIYSNSGLFTKHQHQSRDNLASSNEDKATRLNRSLVERLERWLAPEADTPLNRLHGNQLEQQPVVDASVRLNSAAFSGGGFILMAEAGKKKKKEKSEVVVISVQNSPAKGGGMYPIFIPSCGGHGGHGGGYGRRKRRSVQAYV